MREVTSAPKVRKRGGGAGWLSRPEDAVAAAEAVVRARDDWEERTAQRGPAVSAKLRLPRDGDKESLLRLVNRLAAAGVEWITLHGRRVGEPYGRPSSWAAIGDVATRCPLPLCANGDISSPEDAEALLDLHAFGALMTARGVARAPWLPLLVSRALSRADNDSAGGAAGETYGGITPVEGREPPETYLDTALRFHRYLEEYLPPEFWKSRARRFYT